MERVTSAIDDEYDVVYQQDVLGSPWWKRVPVLRTLATFVLTFDFLRRREPIVLADEFGRNRLILLVLSHYLGCPYLSRIRGSMWKEFRDYSSDTDSVRSTLREYKDTLIRNVILRRSDRILAVSYFNRMQVVYQLHIDPEKVDVVYESCDVRSFDESPEGEFKQKIGVRDDEKLLLTVTNFDYRDKARGIEYFLPAIEAALRTNPECHYAVAGEGSFRQEFERKVLDACDGSIADRIHFVGYYAPIQEAFTDADLVLHPSFRDAIPNTVIEAMAARKAVVVNSDGGMQEALPDEFRRHQVVHRRDEFRVSLETLLSDPSLRRRIGRRNREVAIERFGTDGVERMFEDSFRNVINKEERAIGGTPSTTTQDDSAR